MKKKTIDIICQSCGKTTHGRSDRKLCNDCRKTLAREVSAKWYEDNRHLILDKRKLYSKDYRRRNPEIRLLSGARDRARDQGLEFNLELKDITVPKLCPVFNIPMEVGTPYAPSLDKIDPTKGYVKGNIQVISTKANLMKQNASRKELEAFAEWVIKNQ